MNMPTMNQFVVVALLGISIWLKSPLCASAAVLALALKEAREVINVKQQVKAAQDLDRKIEEFDSKIKSFQNDINRVIVKQAQYFGGE